MELDELKDLWKKNDAVFQLKKESEIASMLRGNSKSIVEKLRRSVWFEIVITTAAGIALLIYAFTMPSGAMKWTFISILVIFVGYSFYYVKKLMLLNSFRESEGNLRDTLENLVAKLSSYLKFYRRSYTILYPVYFFLGLLFSAMERGLESFIDILSQPKTMASLIGLAAIFYFTSTWFVKWVLQKLYGNHLHKLKSILKDLNS